MLAAKAVTRAGDNGDAAVESKFLGHGGNSCKKWEKNRFSRPPVEQGGSPQGWGVADSGPNRKLRNGNLFSVPP
jgi:hypothetical protein